VLEDKNILKERFYGYLHLSIQNTCISFL